MISREEQKAKQGMENKKSKTGGNSGEQGSRVAPPWGNQKTSRERRVRAKKGKVRKENQLKEILQFPQSPHIHTQEGMPCGIPYHKPKALETRSSPRQITQTFSIYSEKGFYHPPLTDYSNSDGGNEETFPLGNIHAFHRGPAFAINPLLV